MKTSLKASLIATAIATLPLGAHAAGLGPINVFSALGQPLRAEIELNATPQELQSLQARIASPEAFRRANLSYSPAMTALKVAVEPRGNRAVVRLSSDRPVNEPFVDLLVELDWATGRLVREYTFLLDPPASSPAGSPMAAPVAPPVAPAPAARAAAPAPAQGGSEQAGQYEVRRGDTLRAIAEAHRPAGASLDQMLIALFRENPDAFDAGNINRMRAGAILSVPAEPAVLAVEAAQARREVVAHAADFNAYRRKMAGAVASRPASGEAEASRVGAGAIVPKVDEPAHTAATGDQVKVSASNPQATSANSDAARTARLQALEEELVARDKALEEANSRLAALESSIREMQQLLELRSEALAQAQKQGAGSAAKAPETPAAKSAPSAPESGAATPAPAEKPAAAPVVPAEKPPAAAKPAPAAQVPAKAPEPVAEPGFLTALSDDPRLLAAGGGVLALLLGYAGFKLRERRKLRPERAGGGPLSELPPVTNSVFGATGGQSVNTSDASVIHTDFSQSGLSAIDADEGVDPVAEADVYMAYGRDAQAEEILLDALKADTSRPAIFLKLLEIYAQRKSLKQFETTASDLYSRTGGEGPDWEKAAVMGRKIDPDNPLYGPSAPAAAVAPAAAAIAATGAAAAAAAVAPAVPAETLDDLDFTTSGPAGIGDIPLIDEPVAVPAPGGGDATADVPILDALPEIDSAALDFDLDADLGLGGTSAEAVEPQRAAPSAQAPDLLAAEGVELDLDMSVEPASADDHAPLNPTVIGDGRDFATAAVADLEFGLDAGAPAAAAEVEATEFDLSATTIMPELDAEAPPAPAEDLEKTTFDSSLLDFDFNIEDASTHEAPAAPAVDLSAIDLDLPAPAEAAPASLDLGGDLPDFSVPESGAVSDEAAGEAREEVETKLELARAYEEMGDKEGARELVEEVLREGSSAQREAANRLLERLA